jgi:spermidine/putrescine transport system ATP-binding protein
MIALEFKNITKKFNQNTEYEKTVVNNISFSVNQGEFFSILGPSGCGKTTCLRMISGLEQPNSGDIYIHGKRVNNVHPHKRNVHMVFQKYALFPHLNVYDNVAFGLRMKKLPESQIKDRVERMLKMVRMSDYKYRSIQQLSGGEQQRIALIRSLVNEPDILLLDEPLGALDLKLREQMQAELSAIQKQLGTTFIFVTHDQWEALTLSTKIAIMNHGKIEQIGTPTEVYENPASAFVAKFVGTTNLFTGRIKEVTPKIVTVETLDYGLISVKPQENKPLPQIGQKVGVVVRPEKIRLRVTAPSSSLQGNSQVTTNNQQNGLELQTITPATLTTTELILPTTNCLRTTIVDRTYFGATTQIKIKIKDSAPLITVLLANQTSTKMPTLRAGDKYYAVWEASDSILVEDVE